MAEFALLTTSLLFGGMILYAFGFAAFVFKSLPADTAGALIRKAFPHFYLFVFTTSGVATITVGFLSDWLTTTLLFIIASTTIFARQVLMPAVNKATDAQNHIRFKILHGLAVAITLTHIFTSGAVIILLSDL